MKLPTLKELNKFDAEIERLNSSLFKVCDTTISNLEIDPERNNYSAQEFYFNQRKVIFRLGKITPKKPGQFVAIWKRNKNTITEPYNVSDDFEFFIIATKFETKFGIFVFSKTTLSENKVITTNSSSGKRGIRVYPNWDIVSNIQAKKSQKWQTKCFLEFSDNDSIDLVKAKKLLSLS